jgi:hypothetical protein
MFVLKERDKKKRKFTRELREFTRVPSQGERKHIMCGGNPEGCGRRQACSLRDGPLGSHGEPGPFDNRQ